MKRLFLVAAVVVMALVMVISTAPALAAGPSAPTAEQLIDQLQNTKTSQEGYALWNSLTPAQQESVRSIVEPKSVSYNVTVTPVPSSVATMINPAVTDRTLGRTYLITVYAYDINGYLWKFKLSQTWYYDGQVVTSAAPPLVTGEIWRIGYEYDGDQTSSWFAPGNTAFYVNTVGNIAWGIYTPWGLIVLGHKYPWINAKYRGDGTVDYNGGTDGGSWW